MAETGLFGITVPPELGGAGLDTCAYAIVMEELSRGYASIADQCGVVELIGTLLSRHGTRDQQGRYFKDILAAKIRIAYCLTEAGRDQTCRRSKPPFARPAMAGCLTEPSFGSTMRR
jgi:alkylation response protein AidB-like acyl-CoA dehydrogenase